MPIYRVQAPNGKIYRIEGPPNADQNTLFGFAQQQFEADELRRMQKEYGPGILETFGRGVKRGAGELASTVTDVIPAAIGSALGFEDYAREQMKEAADKRAAREAEAPPLFPSYKDVEGIRDVPKFVAETIGEQVANIGTSLIPGVGVGAFAGRSAATATAKGLAAQAAQRGLTGEAAEQFVARGLQAAAPDIAQSAARGQAAGLYLGSYAQNAPEVFQNIYENNNGQLAPGAAAIFGAASAALDSVLPAKLARQLTGPAKVGLVEKILEKSGMEKGVLRSVTSGVLGGVATEGLTEGMQEAISIAAEQFVSNNPQVFGSKEWDRIMESAVRGAVAGGAFGGVGGVPEGLRAKYQDQIDAATKQAQETGQPVPLQLGYDPKVGKGLPDVIYVHPDGTTSFVSELSEAALKEKYPEVKFDPAMTPEQRAKEEKAAAIRARQAEQQRLAQLKEDQTALKKAIGELTDVPTDLVSLAQGPSPLEQTIQQAQAQTEALGAKRAPKMLPETAVRGAAPLATPQVSTTTPTVEAQAPVVTPVAAPVAPAVPTTVITEQTLKDFGVGPTALIRKNKLLEGKDISNPEDAAEVKRILEAYAENRSQPIREKIEGFLARPEFRGGPDVARTVEPAGGAGVSLPSEPGAGAAPEAAGPTELGGVVPAGAVAEQPAGREAAEPVAVEAPAPEPGRREQADLAKAQVGAEKAAQEQAQFINEVDQNVDDLLTSRLRETGRSAGLKDADLPSQDYRGSEVHNFLRLPMLFAQYRDSENMLRESAGTPQESKNRQQMAQIEDAISAAGPDAVQIFNRLRQMPMEQQNRSLSELNRLGLQQFDQMAQETVANTKTEIEAQRGPVEERKEEAPRGSVEERKKLSEDEEVERLLQGAYERISPSPKITARVKNEVSRLPEKQVQALESAYGASRDSQPFMQRLQQDIVSYVVRGASAIAQSIRAAVKKVAEGVMAVAVIFNPNINASDFSFNLPAAYARTVQVGEREIRTQVPANAADKMSTTAKGVYESMAPVAMESGKGFIIADKPNGMIHVFKPDGSLLAQESALYGKDTGDILGKSSLVGGPRVTPSGKFTLSAAASPDYTGGMVFRLAESEDATGFIAVHAVYTGDPRENRIKRLASDVPADKRASFGCINTTNDMFLNKLLPNTEQLNGGMIFVLPDSDVRLGQFAPKTAPIFKTTREAAPAAKGERAADVVGREEKLFLPAYEGPTFDAAQQQLAQRGDVNGLLRNLLDQNKDPAIKQALRRLRSLNLKTNVVVGPVEGGRSGSFDPATNTITLDPQNGMNAHTFIHEAIHAAISNVIANPSHPLTKEFQKFFVNIQDRLGAAYGAQDLQEFAAELVSNPSFQAVLKSIKTPRSENMFTRVLRAIAEFFGFAPKTTAFDAGLKFINDALDITNGVEATPAQKMFLGMGNFPAIHQIGNAMPSLSGRTVEATKNYLSNLQGSDFKSLAFGLLRLDNINQMYGKQLPSIQTLLDALEKRGGAQERMIKDSNDKVKNFYAVERKYRPQVERLGKLATEASLEEVDLSRPHIQQTVRQDIWDKMSTAAKQEFLAKEKTREAAYKRLKPQFDALPAEVRSIYATARRDFDAAFKKSREVLLKAAEDASPSLAAQMRERFEANKPLIGYVPFMRYGEFKVEYTDPTTGERATHSFESIRERQQFADVELKNIPHRFYQDIEGERFGAQNLPPSHFVMQVMNKLRENGASQEQLDAVYQAYLSSFPSESIMKQFMKRKGVAGMDTDLIRSYGDLMVRWARKLANAEYLPQIDRSLYQIQQEAGAQSDPTVNAAAQNIMGQSAFFHNPNFGTFTSTATTLSYFEFIAGNISSALVNLTSLPLMVYPLLTGRFGWAGTTNAMLAAGRTAMNDWSKGKYKNLYDTLMDHGQLEHTMSREILEGRRQKSSDFLGVKARIMDGLSIPFAAAERYNRGVTAIAAYDLARNSGMNEQDAIRYALDSVKTAHTSGMAATGPKWMQTPMGRMFFTFKSFAWNSAYVMARAFHQAFKGEDPAIRAAARRQLLATYGMATVFVGVKGMPFYGAASVMAQMLNAMMGDDDEPFDFDEFMRNIFGEFLFKGAFNYATNLEISNRAGIATDLLFRDDPRGVAEHGYVLSAMQNAFGPAGSIAVNSGRAIEMFNNGQIERAIETLAPSFVRNGLKGARYMIEGATTLKGDPVMEDISAYNSLMQVIGFSPADLSSQYERVQAAKGFEREVLQRRSKLLDLSYMGYTAGDSEMIDEARAKIDSFNQAHPGYQISADSIARSIRARKAAEKDMIHGVRFSKKLRPEIEAKFFEDED